jgi:DNA repair protein RadC
VREFLLSSGQAVPSPSAYELLAFLLALPEIPQDVRQTAERLLTRVDESYQLPLEVDLLADAAWLAQALETQLQNK